MRGSERAEQAQTLPAILPAHPTLHAKPTHSQPRGHAPCPKPYNQAPLRATPTPEPPSEGP